MALIKLSPKERSMLLHALRIGIEDGSLHNDEPKLIAAGEALIEKLDFRRRKSKLPAPPSPDQTEGE